MVVDVLSSARFVCEQSVHVKICNSGIDRLAHSLIDVPPPEWDTDHHFFDGGGRTVDYLLVLDALNFCFFPEPRWKVMVEETPIQGYFALSSILKQAFEREDPWTYDFNQLAEIEEGQLRDILQGAVPMGGVPLLERRAQVLRELGYVIVRRFNARPANLVHEAGHSALRLVGLLSDNFNSFRDESSYKGRKVGFYKRAQIFAGDLFASFHGRSFGEFHDIGALTAFADYKIPQILRDLGVISYSPELAGLVDTKSYIEAGSSYEVEMRAGTICAVDMLCTALTREGRDLLPMELDWALWGAAQGRGMRPHHRTFTIYY
ncbi:MAG: queuosine salvage family protein [Candidatus Bipolaricaulota bacterium]|nr:queuosine salvage family protein [Candidatus Bipolaricaulota bacterium]